MLTAARILRLNSNQILGAGIGVANAGISREHRFESWLLDSQSSSLLRSLGKKQKVAKCKGSLHPAQHTWMESEAPSVSLTQPQSWQALRSELQMEDLSLSAPSVF